MNTGKTLFVRIMDFYYGKLFNGSWRVMVATRAYGR